MLYRIKLANDIKKKIKAIKPDLVHAHFLTDSGWIGAWTNFHPLIVTAHGSDVLIHPTNSVIYRLVVSFVLKKSDKVIIVAEHLKRHLEKFGCPKNKIIYIPNYVNTNFFIFKSDFISKFQDVQDSPKIISARMLDPIYDVGTLIHAASKIVKFYPKAKFIIIGDGQEYYQLVKLVKELNLTQNFNFVGRVEHNELAEYFKKSHIYISTAISDGLSVTTLEGMASGLFPIVTDIAANNTLVKNNANGYLFTCKNSDLLSEKILKIISNPKLMTEISKKNLDFIYNNFSTKQILKTTEKIYYNLILLK